MCSLFRPMRPLPDGKEIVKSPVEPPRVAVETSSRQGEALVDQALEFAGARRREELESGWAVLVDVVRTHVLLDQNGRRGRRASFIRTTLHDPAAGGLSRCSHAEAAHRTAGTRRARL